MDYKVRRLSKQQDFKRVTPLRMVILYALISGAWILFSDRLLSAIVTDPRLLLKLSIAKGWFYVAVMTVLLYVLVQKGREQYLARYITERKNAWAMVLLEKERAQVTLDSIGDAVITTNVYGNVEYLNPSAEALTGWTNAEAAGLSLEKIFQIVNEETSEPVNYPIVRCLQEGNSVELPNQAVLMHRNGTTMAIEDSATPIRNRANVVIGGVLVFHDVSDKRNLMKELDADRLCAK